MAVLPDELARLLNSLFELTEADPDLCCQIEDALSKEGFLPPELHKPWRYLLSICDMTESHEILSEARRLVPLQANARRPLWDHKNGKPDELDHDEAEKILFHLLPGKHHRYVGSLTTSQRRALTRVAEHQVEAAIFLLEQKDLFGLCSVPDVLDWVDLLENKSVRDWRILFDPLVIMASRGYAPINGLAVLHQACLRASRIKAPTAQMGIRIRREVPWSRLPAPAQNRIQKQYKPFFDESGYSFGRFVRNVTIDIFVEGLLVDITWVDPLYTAFVMPISGENASRNAGNRLRCCKLLALASQTDARRVDFVLYRGDSFDREWIDELESITRAMGIGFGISQIPLEAGRLLPPDEVEPVLLYETVSTTRRTRKSNQQKEKSPPERSSEREKDASGHPGPQEETPAAADSPDSKNEASSKKNLAENLAVIFATSHDSAEIRWATMIYNAAHHPLLEDSLRDRISTLLDASSTLDSESANHEIEATVESKLTEPFDKLRAMFQKLSEAESASSIDGPPSLDAQASDVFGDLKREFEPLTEELQKVELLEALLHPRARRPLAIRLDTFGKGGGRLKIKETDSPVTELLLNRCELFEARLASISNKSGRNK